jgi:hypothetical protein
MVTLTTAEGKDFIVLYVDKKILISIPVWELCCSDSFDSVYSFFVELSRNSSATKQNNISVNGVPHSAPESASEAESADVSCTPAEEQVQAQGKLIL